MGRVYKRVEPAERVEYPTGVVMGRKLNPHRSHTTTARGCAAPITGPLATPLLRAAERASLRPHGAMYSVEV